MKKIIIILPILALLATACNSQSQANKSVAPQTSQTPTANSLPSPAAIKTYTNEPYGFSFQYPNSWTDANQPIEDGDYFNNPLGIDYKADVLDLSLSKDSGTFQDMATKEIQENACPATDNNGQPADHIIKINGLGVLFVENCSATSESYIYLFKNTKGQVIEMSYHDDFDENVTEAQKIVTLNQIIESIKTY